MKPFLSRAWALFTQEFSTFFTIAVVSQLFLTLLGRLAEFLDGHSIDAVYTQLSSQPSEILSIISQHWCYVALFCIATIAEITVGTFVVHACVHHTHSIRAATSGALKLLPKTILMSFVLTLIIGAGMLLFIIPGIIAAVFFTFASPLIIVHHNPSIGRALSESAVLGKKYFFRIFWMLFMLNLGVYILTALWNALTSSVSIYIGADFVVTLVSELIVIYSTLTLTYFGLSLIEENEKEA